MSDIIKIKLNKNSKNLLLDRNAFFCPNNTLFFNKKIIYQLQTVGREKKENVRVCLHSDKDDELHEMIIYQQKNNFYPPKMHINKTKSFLIVEGELVIVTKNGAWRRGACVVAVFTKDVAETKATRATDAGRKMGFPLLFGTEPEE